MATIDSTSPSGVQPNGFASGWTLTMSDEFNSTVLDTKWQAFHSYQDFGVPTNYDLNAGNNSCLRIYPVSPFGSNETEFRTLGSNPFRQRFGFYEVRCQACRGRGMFLAPLWMFDDSTEQEVDVCEMEAYENTDWLVDTSNFRLKNASFTVWQDGGGGSTIFTGSRFLGGHTDPVTNQVANYDNTLSTAFHTFGLDWNRDTGVMQWYLDGAKRGSSIQDPWGSANNVQLYVLIGQLWWGPRAGLPTPDGNTPTGTGNPFLIDYVRVWSNGGSPAPSPSPSPSPAPTFIATLESAPNDGATVNGNVAFQLSGQSLANAELLPSSGYTPMYGRFTISNTGSRADLNWDTTQISNTTSFVVRISAFDQAPGVVTANEIVAMTARSYVISNISAPPVSVSASSSSTASAQDQLTKQFCIMSLSDGKYTIR